MVDMFLFTRSIIYAFGHMLEPSSGLSRLEQRIVFESGILAPSLFYILAFGIEFIMPLVYNCFIIILTLFLLNSICECKFDFICCSLFATLIVKNTNLPTQPLRL